MRHLALAAVLVLLAVFGQPRPASSGAILPAAAEQEDGVAAFQRGDYATALRAFMPLAEQGDATAQVRVASAYFLMGPTNFLKAAEWFRRAAEQGHPGGQLGLAEMFWGGWGLPQSYVQAHMWSSLAESGLPPAQRARAIEIREDVTQWMAPDQIAEAEKLKREWLENYESRD